MLGVCLGHQCIGQVYGGDVVRAGQIMHGKTSLIHHDGTGVFAGLPEPLEATRYHSLVVDRASVPDELIVTAWTDDGTIMGLRHRHHAVEGVQFHPESILTAAGHDLLRNFLATAATPTPKFPTGRPAKLHVAVAGVGLVADGGLDLVDGEVEAGGAGGLGQGAGLPGAGQPRHGPRLGGRGAVPPLGLMRGDPLVGVGTIECWPSPPAKS